MTVSAAYTPAVYTANGTANQFNFGFSALRTQDVWLVEHDKDTGAVVHEFQGGSGLTVSLGSGFVIIDDYNERPLAGNKVTVYRRTQATQTVDLDPTVPVSSDAVEGMSDKLTLLAQEAQNFGDDYTDLQQYAAQAEAALESLQDLYIGVYADDVAANAAHPTRPVGALYFSSNSDNLRLWNGTAWEVVATSTADFLLRDGSAPMTGALLAAVGSAAAPGIAFTNDPDTGMYLSVGGNMSLAHSGADKLLVSGTSITSVVPLRGTDGSAAAPTFSFTNDTDTGIYLSGANTLSIAAGGGEAFRVGSTGCAFVVAGTTTYTATASGFIPNPDNVRSLGVSGARWTEVYATTGTINTSDAREKTAVEPMSKHEIAAAKALAREIGTFQWLESIEKKGDGARRHVGLTVQRAIEIMESHDLDPFSYAFICYDEWEADEEQNREAGDRYSFRTDQLNLFIARGLEARITALEAALR